ncbi:hypothetical protein [Aliiroseovarius subalbicans]|uniref:hypothetical protein n=1 Tax=Aliiroseovarius subalbicans TaxID=2925840 RepID=UPI001F589EF5|nr:hypothetical protein [Aliiroseovarius subalbicans]MCI2398356.1 hypothetical protein [Aliiroseovarius subalbicans]
MQKTKSEDRLNKINAQVQPIGRTYGGGSGSWQNGMSATGVEPQVGVDPAAGARRTGRQVERQVNMKATVAGGICGGVVGIAVRGLAQEGSPWGPGSGFGDVIGIPALTGFAMAPVLAIAGLLLSQRRPALVNFTLAYFLAAIATTIF